MGAPDAVGYLLGRRLRAQGVVDADPAVFADARAEAEHLAWRRHGDACDLGHVARELARLLALPAARADVLLEAELDLERELSRDVPGAVRRVRAVREAGRRVGFLSDTRLPRELVDELLRRHGLRERSDELWVSNDLRGTKTRSTAFSAVAARLAHRPGGVPRRWVHVGDNVRSDVRNARLSGVRPVHLPDASLNRYEHRLERDRVRSGGLASVLAGASRRARLVVAEERPEVPRARVEVVAGVAGPLYAGYLLWCFEQARRAGIRRLYFVARDGEVLLDMARVLVDGLGLDLELHYLHGSRRAWLLPSMTTVEAQPLAAVAGRNEKATVRSTLGWVDLAPETVEGPLTRLGFPPPSWDRALDGEEVTRLVHVVEDPEVAPLLAEVAAERARAAETYLRQVGLLDGRPFALVEMTGRGSVGRFLTALLARFGAQPPAGEYYFGLDAPAHDAVGRSLHGYAYDEWQGTGLLARADTDIWVPLEVFSQARHGTVERYELVDGSARPVLREERNEKVLGWGLDDLRATLDVFCRELAPLLPLVDVRGDVRRVTWDLLRMFWTHPTPAEVEAWSSFPFEDGASVYRLGDPFSTAELLASLRQGRPRFRRRGSWPAAVRENAPPHVKVLRAGVDGAAWALEKGRRAQELLEARRRVRAGA